MSLLLLLSYQGIAPVKILLNERILDLGNALAHQILVRPHHKAKLDSY